MDERITRTLKRARRRMEAQRFLERLAVCALLAGAIGVAVLAAGMLRGEMMSLRILVPGLLAFAFLPALILAAVRRLSLRQTARRLDVLAGTRDRFTTALSLGGREGPGAFESCALEECGRFGAGFDPRPFTRISLPRRAPWLAVPAVAVALLLWGGQLRRDAARPDPGAQAALEEKARELAKLASEVEKANETAQTEALKKIAEEMRKSVAQLRTARVQSPVEAQKAALRELSSLEAQLAQMKKGGASPEELAALTEALRQAELTKPAADALGSGDAGAAAAQLEKLGQNAAAASAEEREKLARAMREAMEKLGGAENAQSTLAKAMAQVAQASARAEAAQRALQRLAEALRQAGVRPQVSQRSGSGAQSQQALEQLLRALQDIKFGLPSPGLAMPFDGKNPPGGRIAMHAGTGDGPVLPLAGDPGAPSGRAGSERDTGTTKTPLGGASKSADAGARAQDLTGVLGEGESLQSLIATQGDTSRATQRYRALYEAMAPAAEDALMQENIPLGSRFFVKRYFESIRPGE